MTGLAGLSGASRQLERDFPPEPASAPAARRFVLAAHWSDDEDLNLRLATLISELVTNAILHARTPFKVRVGLRTNRIRVSVTDGSRSEPVRRPYVPTRPTGRGLHIVDSLSDDWGFTPEGDGKTVWFELVKEQDG